MYDTHSDGMRLGWMRLDRTFISCESEVSTCVVNEDHQQQSFESSVQHHTYYRNNLRHLTGLHHGKAVKAGVENAARYNIQGCKIQRQNEETDITV